MDWIELVQNMYGQLAGNVKNAISAVLMKTFGILTSRYPMRTNSVGMNVDNVALLPTAKNAVNAETASVVGV
jgi:hypothetical protein